MSPPGNPWKILIPRHANPNANRNIYVHNDHYADWQAIKNSHAGNYYLGSIMRAAYSLNAQAGGRTDKPTRLVQPGFAIHYQFDDRGNIRLLAIDIDEKYEIPSGQQATGLYEVQYSKRSRDNRWRTDDNSKAQMTVSHRWKDAHYAAVAGKFDDKEQAGEKLVDHIRNAYAGELRGHEIDRPNKHYSLFWQNGGHKSDRQRDQLVSLLQQAMGQKARVHWIAQGEGAGTFVRAMQALTAAPKLHGAEGDAKIRARQSVYFSNPRGKGTTTRELEALCKQVGFELAGINRNPDDLWDAESHAAHSERFLPLIAKIGIGGTVGAFGFDTVMKSLGLVAQSATVGGAALTGLGCYVVGKGVYNDLSGHARNLKGICKNTLGKGNQNWAA